MKGRAALIAFAALSVVVVSWPRFNRGGPIPWSPPRETPQAARSAELWDAGQYIGLVQRFRGLEPTGESLRAPFVYRPAVPFLASLLPFDAMTSINLVNLLALVLATACLARILELDGLPPRLQWIGCALFVVSFPTHWYGAIGYVDPGAVAVVTVGLLLIRLRMWISVVVAIALGAVVKESTLVLLPVLVSTLFGRAPARRPSPAICVFAAAAFLIPTVAIRASATSAGGYVWEPSLSWLRYNLVRPRTWMSLAATAGVPALLLAWASVRRRRTDSIPREALEWIPPYVVGILSALALWGWSLVSAHTDGRLIWLAYPFAIPLVISRLGDRER